MLSSFKIVRSEYCVLAPKTQWILRRTLPFSIIWVLTGALFYVVESAAGGNATSQSEAGIHIDYKILLFSLIAMAVAGFFVGLLEVFIVSRLYSERNFIERLLLKLVTYLLILSLIIFITYPIAASLGLEASILSKEVWNKYLLFLSSPAHFSTIFQLLFTIGLCIFYDEISSSIGHSILAKFFTGKYHSPIEEERIFMFADMKSSTTIAENLGHIQYFKLLKSYYDVFSDAILKNHGEIYQYVGDEIVITWPLQEGLRSQQCVQCFFEMKKSLEIKSDWFIQEFGIAPRFKAGLHVGKVTTGEIGAIKKDIIFTGDILNATARIQSLCNTYQKDLLISEILVKKLDLSPTYMLTSLGKSELRGKNEEISLYSIAEKT